MTLLPARTRRTRRLTAGTPPLARPDVGVIVSADADPRATIVAAVQAAASRGGLVCVMRCVDDTAIPFSRRRIRVAQQARVELAAIVSEYASHHPAAAITERLHRGTLASLLSTLEPGIGAVLVPAGSEVTPEVAARCPVPVTVVTTETATAPLS